MILLRLFWEFFKTGLFAVGGGMATLPFLYDMSARTGWFTQARLADMIAVSESTPGPIGVNMATYVGFETAGIPGAVVATLGLICPSIIIIILIARVLKQFRESKTVDAVFYGLRPCSIALIAAAGLLVARVTFLNQDALAAGFNPAELLRWKELLLAAVLLVLTRFVEPLKKLHPVVFIALSAAVGILFAF
ncbi:MAG: chromate transporter [Oscillospiraceae bacterium]|nr:chromate transporter [Oscillospiraceae bacterium]